MEIIILLFIGNTSTVNSNIIGVRKRGRPRRRWQEDVEEELRRFDVRRWKEKARY